MISAIEVITGEGSSGGTYAGIGLFTVAANEDLVLVAKGEDTTSPTYFSSGYQGIGGFDTKVPLSVPYAKVAGQLYAVGALFIGSGAPNIVGAVSAGGDAATTFGSGGLLPRLSALWAGQLTLPAVGGTIASGDLTGLGLVPYFLLEV